MIDPAAGVLAVGWHAGVSSDDPVDGETSGWVHLGGRPERLTEEHLLVWRAAHGAPQHAADRPWTAADVTAVAAAAGVPATAVAPALDELHARRLVAVVRPGGAGLRAFAQRHTLLPLAEGLGNSAAAPEVFSYGLGGRPLVQLPRTLYEAVALASRWPDLWSACSGLAAMAVRDAVPVPAARDAEQLLAWLVGSLPALLSAHVAGLDLGGAA